MQVKKAPESPVIWAVAREIKIESLKDFVDLQNALIKEVTLNLSLTLNEPKLGDERKTWLETFINKTFSDKVTIYGVKNTFFDMKVCLKNTPDYFGLKYKDLVDETQLLANLDNIVNEKISLEDAIKQALRLDNFADEADEVIDLQSLLVWIKERFPCLGSNEDF